MCFQVQQVQFLKCSRIKNKIKKKTNPKLNLDDLTLSSHLASWTLLDFFQHDLVCKSLNESPILTTCTVHTPISPRTTSASNQSKFGVNNHHTDWCMAATRSFTKDLFFLLAILTWVNLVNINSTAFLLEMQGNLH